MTVEAPIRIQIRNILFATDFSSCSNQVFPYALSLARQYGAHLFIGHATTPQNLVEPPMLNSLRENTLKEMSKLREDPLLQGIRHNELIAAGAVWPVIARMIEEHGIDLVVAGTHGRTGLKRFVMGSAAEEIFRQSPCPVLIVGPDAQATPQAGTRPADQQTNGPPLREIKRILYAIDLSSDSAISASYAVALAEEHQAELLMLHVTASGPSERHALEATHDPVRIKNALAEKMLELLPEDAGLWCEPRAMVQFGDPAAGIIAVAKEQKSDLIILGAHRPTLMTTHMMDVAYAVVCHAPCPVLTVNVNFQPGETHKVRMIF